MKLIAFLALFVHASVSLPDGKVHFGATYCLPTSNGPQGWARTHDKLENDFQRYSIQSQTDNCDVLAKQVRGQLNF